MSQQAVSKLIDAEAASRLHQGAVEAIAIALARGTVRG